MLILTNTMTKILESVNVHSNEKNRLNLEKLLFSNLNLMNKCVKNVILYDETIKQKTSSGKTIPELIN